MLLLGLATVLFGTPAARAGEAAPAGAVVVLDLERGSFRAFMGWRTPTLVTADGKLLPMREPQRQDLKDEERKAIPKRESARPATDPSAAGPSATRSGPNGSGPVGWAAPAFDDSAWCRMRGPAVVQEDGADWDLVCVRGKFFVTDPARVQGLRLDASYCGGVRVLVNGTELTRAHLAAGELKPDALGERYPEEAYIRPDGKLYGPRDGKDQALAERMKVRVRRLAGRDQAAGVAIPAEALRKGINVVAIESRGAPISELAFDAPLTDKAAPRGVWPHAGVVAARLTCASADGLVPNAGPAAGIRIANVSPAETLTVWDYAHPAEALRPVRLVGARNGVFSGRVVLSSAEAIKGLKAAAGELVQAEGAGKIPAAAVQVRWAEVAAPDKSWGLEGRFDRLLSEPPPEVAPAKAGKPEAASAAVVPVWITVRVPADAAARDYRGSVTIEANGAAAEKFTVPVELRVHAWKVPDPGDFATVNNICQSPDSVAQYYKVQPWSDAHFAMIGRSLGVFHQVGSRICALNLIVKMHGYGNSESMVKWIKKDDGGFDYDFSVAEKYMDVYAKACGKPMILQVNAWAFPGDTPERPKWPQASVTVVDKDGKKLEDMLQPPYGTPENEAFWRPVFAELQKRLEKRGSTGSPPEALSSSKRGWYDVAHIGWLAYQNGPSKGIAEVAKKIWPDGKWIKNSHQASKDFFGMPVAWNSAVWGVGAPYDPDCETAWKKRPVYPPAGRLAYPRPWASSDNIVGNPRWGSGFVLPGLYGHGTLMRYRDMAEAALQGNIRGMGQLGGDFWPVPVGDRGRLGTICTGEGAVTPRVNTLALASPGPDGAIFNERLEMLREGIQIAEAMIFLQKALAAKSAGDELARRIEGLLDERARGHLRNRNPFPVGPSSDPGGWMTRECTDWQARDAELLALAGEVAAKLK